MVQVYCSHCILMPNSLVPFFVLLILRLQKKSGIAWRATLVESPPSQWPRQTVESTNLLHSSCPSKSLCKLMRSWSAPAKEGEPSTGRPDTRAVSRANVCRMYHIWRSRFSLPPTSPGEGPFHPMQVIGHRRPRSPCRAKRPDFVPQESAVRTTLLLLKPIVKYCSSGRGLVLTVMYD